MVNYNVVPIEYTLCSVLNGMESKFRSSKDLATNIESNVNVRKNCFTTKTGSELHTQLSYVIFLVVVVLTAT